MTEHTYWSQKTAWGNWFSAATMWVLKMDLRSQGMTVGIFTTSPTPRHLAGLVIWLDVSVKVLWDEFKWVGLWVAQCILINNANGLSPSQQRVWTEQRKEEWLPLCKKKFCQQSPWSQNTAQFSASSLWANCTGFGAGQVSTMWTIS